MKWILGSRKVEVPDSITAGRSFAVIIGGKSHRATWHDKHGVLTIETENGIERNVRIADTTLLRSDGDGSTVFLRGRIGLTGPDPKVEGLRQALILAVEASVDMPGANSGQRAKKRVTAVKSPITGKVLSCSAKNGDSVDQGTVVLVIEAMKMENRIAAPAAGTVSDCGLQAGAAVKAGDLLFKITPHAN